MFLSSGQGDWRVGSREFLIISTAPAVRHRASGEWLSTLYSLLPTRTDRADSGLSGDLRTRSSWLQCLGTAIA